MCKTGVFCSPKTCSWANWHFYITYSTVCDCMHVSYICTRLILPRRYPCVMPYAVVLCAITNKKLIANYENILNRQTAVDHLPSNAPDLFINLMIKEVLLIRINSWES